MRQRDPARSLLRLALGLVLGASCGPAVDPGDRVAETVAASRAQARGELQRGDPAAAVATLGRALPHALQDPQLWNDLGLAWLAGGEADSAAACFERSIRIAPQRAEAHLNLAVLLMRRGITGRARTEFAEAVGAEPSNPLPYWNFAAALVDVGKPELAREQLEHALRLDPQSGPAHAEMGRVELLAGRLAEALAHFGRAESLGVNDARLLANYGLALLGAGRLTEAEIRLDAATQRDSTRAAAWNHLGVVRSQLGRVEAALAPFRRAGRLEPSNEDYRFNLASALLRLQRYHEAEIVLRDPRPARADLLAAWGMALRGQDRGREALPLLGEAAVRAPRDVGILNNYGVVLAETGDVPAALAVWRQVLEIDPGNAPARDNIGARTVSAPSGR